MEGIRKQNETHFSYATYSCDSWQGPPALALSSPRHLSSLSTIASQMMIVGSFNHNSCMSTDPLIHYVCLQSLQTTLIATPKSLNPLTFLQTFIHLSIPIPSCFTLKPTHLFHSPTLIDIFVCSTNVGLASPILALLPILNPSLSFIYIYVTCPSITCRSWIKNQQLFYNNLEAFLCLFISCHPSDMNLRK